MLLSALIIRNGKLLSLAIPFLVYLIVGFIQAPGKIKLTATRTIDKVSVYPLEPVNTRIEVMNLGNGLVNLHLNDSIYSKMTILEGQVEQILSLSPGESTELNYKFEAARGVYSWEKIHACASDPFGLFDRGYDFPAPGEILVRPAPMKIRQMVSKPRFTLHSAGPISARLAGLGTDFWGIRQYRAGDSLRRLNWRLAARHPQKLFTNEYEREEIADFGLILDTRKLTHADTLDEALFEYSVSAAISFSDNYIKNGHRVSLLVFGKSITTLFPGYGKKQINALRRNLSRATLGAYVPLNYLEYFPTRLFPARSVITIFSTVDPRDIDVYARLRAIGYDVLLITPDAVDFYSRILRMAELDNLAIRAARVARVIYLKRLLKLGVKVIDWQVDTPLETTIHKTMRQFIQRRNI